MLGSTRDKKYEKKSWDTIFIVMFVYIYFFGYYVVHLLLVLLFFFFLGLEICSNFESGSSMVWNAGSKHIEGVIWDLKFCSNLKWGGLEFASKHVGGVIWLGDYPSLKSSGPTAWHLNPNTLGGDLAWDYPSLKSSNCDSTFRQIVMLPKYQPKRGGDLG